MAQIKIKRILNRLGDSIGMLIGIAVLYIIMSFFFSFVRGEKEMSFRYVGSGGNCVGCEWYAAEGKITPESAEKFALFLEQRGVDAQLDILLDSKGGSLLGAMELGRLIRQKGLRTYVGKTVPDEYGYHQQDKGKCLNECVVAFLGGLDRHANVGEVGIRSIFRKRSMRVSDNDSRFRNLDYTERIKGISGLLIKYLSDMNVSTDLYSIAAVKRKSIKYFDEQELDSLVINSSQLEVSSWRMELLRNGLAVVNQNKLGEVRSLIACQKKDAILKMYINLGDPSIYDYYESWISKSDKLFFGREEIKSSEYALKRADQNTVLVINIPSLSAFEGYENSNEVSVSFAVPPNFMSSFYWEFPKENLMNLVAVASQQCHE